MSSGIKRLAAASGKDMKSYNGSSGKAGSKIPAAKKLPKPKK